MEVEFFDSAEEAAQALEQAMKAADARVRPWQAAAEPGQCFITLAEDGLVVFGEVLECYAERRLRHYRFCRCHSLACPEGELGDVHVCTIRQFISREAFEQARARGWGPVATGANAPGPFFVDEVTAGRRPCGPIAWPGNQRTRTAAASLRAGLLSLDAAAQH